MSKLVSTVQRIVIAGVAPITALGDALQYYVANRLLSYFLPEADITLMCPSLRKGISVFRALKLNGHLSSLGLTGAGLLRYFLHLLPIERSVHEKCPPTLDRKTTGDGTVSRITRIVARKTEASYMFAKCLSSPIMRSLFSFDAGIFGGHTISCDPYYYVVQYHTLCSVVRGSVLTSPVSISRLALERGDRNLLERLKQSLRRLDFIYVRGPVSLGILRDCLKISEGRVAMALDSGFGIRRIHPDIIASGRRLGKQGLRIVIVPRKEYYHIYNRWNLYKSYLDALVGLILWLSRSFDVEVYLASQTVSYSRMSDQSAIDDVVRLLERRAGSNRRCLKRLSIVKPSSIMDASRLYSSADLLITSRMHAGITALSAGVPAVFVIPSAGVKVRDVLSFLGLDTNSFMIDMFDINALTAENFISKIKSVLDNLEYHTKIAQFAVERALPTIELPFKMLGKLLK